MYVLSVQSALEQGQALHVCSLKRLSCEEDQKNTRLVSNHGQPNVSSPDEVLTSAALSARSASVLLSDRSRLLAVSLGSCIQSTATFYSLRRSLRGESVKAR